ncbi:hypothetical protein N7478_010088 [Penicillium angulare]|uniref:uncharacterized protein n=1 Tax=Penicillium angulare TaxID=116970 RepID=UPI00253FCE0B|nr:uncharacterized protein N7478_010088 [Penicillium angulare]KAJ5267280.1 hypothetical protein N7478_010088 [Penicillium angulare]
MALVFDENLSSQKLADILPIGVAILNNQDELVSANRRLRELIRYSSIKFPQCWLQSIHPEDYNRVATGYYEAIASKRALHIEHHTSEPDCLWRVATLNPLDGSDLRRSSLDNDGGFIYTVADITTEEQAELSQRQIAQEVQKRREQQERFIDMISHEIRNPLSAVLHCTEDILEAMRGKKKEDILLSQITEAAETISLCIAHKEPIVNDALTISKLDASMLSLSPRRVQPKCYLISPLAIFRPELRKQNIQFEYKFDYSYGEFGERANDPSLHGSFNGQAIILPPNVVFFRLDDTTLCLDATGTPEWGKGQMAYIMVAVKDTGIGITELAQKQLFERFNQATPRTESTYGSSGLGLSVSRKLCHLHGGEIGLCSDIQALGNEMTGVNQRTEEPEISENPIMAHIAGVNTDSNDDQRTRHTSELARQVSDKSIVNKHQSQSADCGDETTRRHILLVEDNIINRRIISRKLSSFGFHISEASNGQEALDVAQHDIFDCILMDQEMPVMDGNLATKAIRDFEKETGTHVPMLGVTANVRAVQETEMLRAGMDYIIHKPYGTDELIERI